MCSGYWGTDAVDEDSDGFCGWLVAGRVNSAAAGPKNNLDKERKI